MSRFLPQAVLTEIRDAHRHLHTPDQPVEAATSAAEDIIISGLRDQPRNHQKRIGPSEVGMACDHCLAAKLAGWEKREPGILWAAGVGTAVHALIEQFVADKYAQHITDSPRGEETRFQYWAEQPVTVGTIGGQQITGSTDLLDVKTGTIVDWKAVSKTSLANVKRDGISDQYRVQAHLYAKGWNDAGIHVDTVSVCFLPRTTSNFYDRHWWTEPFKPKIALDALERANNLHANLAALEAVSVRARDEWITSLPRDPDCWDCRRYEDFDGTTVEQGIVIDVPNLKKNKKTEK